MWKWELEIEDEQDVMIPEDAHFLSVQAQGNKVVLWGLVNVHAKAVPHRILMVGTGHPFFKGEHHYLGTVQTHGGDLVLHVFLRGS